MSSCYSLMFGPTVAELCWVVTAGGQLFADLESSPLDPQPGTIFLTR